MENIHRVLQCCWEEEYIPKEWMEEVVLPIYNKEGDITQIGNYRGVTLGSHFGKLFRQILKRELTTVVKGRVSWGKHREALGRRDRR